MLPEPKNARQDTRTRASRSSAPKPTVCPPSLTASPGEICPARDQTGSVTTVSTAMAAWNQPTPR